MEIKDFMQEMFKENPKLAIETAKKLIDLESIENYLNIMWGVNLKVTIEPAEPREGRFYGKGIVESLL